MGLVLGIAKVTEATGALWCFVFSLVYTGHLSSGCSEFIWKHENSRRQRDTGLGVTSCWLSVPAFPWGARLRGRWMRKGRVWWACLQGWFLGLGLATTHTTEFIFKLVASGLCLSPHREPPTACQERPHRSLGQHPAQLG